MDIINLENESPRLKFDLATGALVGLTAVHLLAVVYTTQNIFEGGS
jgi:hypothetical protein